MPAPHVTPFPLPFWQELINGIDKPLIKTGYIQVPNNPGLGVTLNDEVCNQNLDPENGYFEPPPMWDEPEFRFLPAGASKETA